MDSYFDSCVACGEPLHDGKCDRKPKTMRGVRYFVDLDAPDTGIAFSAAFEELFPAAP